MNLGKILPKPLFISICILAYLSLNACSESLPISGQESVEFTQSKYENANYKRGGLLYDKWWVANNSNQPTGLNPIWEFTANPSSSNSNNGGQWRCKTCHGWDYKGRNGAYNSSSANYTGVRGLDNANSTFTPESVFGVITNGVVKIRDGLPSTSAPEASHSFLGNGKLSESDAYDLTRFIIDFANKDSVVSSGPGSEERGKLIFENLTTSFSCGSLTCHDSEAAKAVIIEIAKTNEPEFLHKVRIGNPGTSMPGGLNNRQAQDVLAYVKAGATAITPIDSVAFSETLYNSLTNENIARGGRLYDKWWAASTAPSAIEPSANHILWPSSNTSKSKGTTWRCKSCHGWDYAGKDGAYQSGSYQTGIKGIVNSINTQMQLITASNVFAYIRESDNHSFSSLLSDTDLYDLTKFIMTVRDEEGGNRAPSDFIDSLTALAKNADSTIGKSLFDSTSAQCSACHGVDGKMLDFDDGDLNTEPNVFLHNIAIDNPWEFIHKVRYGQPDSIMKGLIESAQSNVTTIQTAADILAYSQTSLVPNIKRAGLLYDKWWLVDGVKNNTPPTNDNRTWLAKATTPGTATGANTWRCKECHGWDYDGAQGAYNTSSKHYTGIRGFITSSSTQGKSDAILLGALKGSQSSIPDHDFSNYLSDEDLSLLIQFIKDRETGVPQSAALTSALNNGDITLGQVLYNGTKPGNCSVCHGADGLKTPSVNVGALARENPSEFLHKIRYGNPGSIMLPSSTGFFGLRLDQAGDVLKYAQSKLDIIAQPDATYATANLERGGRLYDNWWLEMKTSDENVLAPSAENPHWRDDAFDKSSLSASKVVTDSWRCKTCHAWDYKGINFFGTNSGVDNLLEQVAFLQNSSTPAQLQTQFFYWLRDGKIATGKHGFGLSTNTALPTKLGDREIWDLIKFLLESNGMVDSDTKLQSDGQIRFSTATSIDTGRALFLGSSSTPEINCSQCHGINGDEIPPAEFGGSDAAPDLFKLAYPAPIGDPWEFLHKIRFGQPGTSMPSLSGSNITIEDAYDLLGYAQGSYIPQ